MSDPVSLEFNIFRVNDNIAQYIFTIGSIGASSEQEITLDVSVKGIVKGLRCVNLSTDYDLSLRTETELTTPSIKEILLIEDINQTYQEMDLFIPYICDGDLYLYITNNDASNATGEFQLELLVSISGE